MKENRKAFKGFTLVEMLVVLIIVGILATIGIFGWGALKASSASAEAKAAADRVFAAQATISRDWGKYTPYGKDLVQAGPELTYKENGAPSAGQTDISMVVGNRGTLGIAVKDSEGTCHYIRYEALVKSGDNHEVTNKPASAPCSGRESLPQGEAVTLYTPGGTVKTIN